MVERSEFLGQIKHKPGCDSPYKYQFHGYEGDACGKGYVTCRDCGQDVQIHWSATGRDKNPTFKEVQDLLNNNGF